MKVLTIFANPRGTSTLRLGEEDRTIRECIRRSRYRDTIELIVRHAATVDDVRRALLEDEFSIIHFSGHGTHTGLAFEARDGALYVPPRDALADLLADYSPPLECVLLNACYSISQGEFTSMGLPYTVAMERPIADESAIMFSSAFYDAVGAGKDIEFAYRQGIHALRLASQPDSSVPILLRKGERHIRVSVSPSLPAEAHTPGDTVAERSTALIGIALDVSGSMEASIQNRDGSDQTRLDAVREALARAVDTVVPPREKGQIPTDDSAFLFAYAFGLRTGSVCDLFTLLRIAPELINAREVDDLTKRYSEEVRTRYTGGGLGDLESLARSYGLGGFVESAKAQARASAEAEVRSRVMSEVQRRMTENLRAAGDTTLRVPELANLWHSSSGRFKDAEQVIFGSTPMCEALQQVELRLTRELQKLGPSGTVLPVLLLVSDGEPTDGDPEPIAERLRDQGLTIVSCYLTDIDLQSPRRLTTTDDSRWPEGARRLFRMASVLPSDSPLTHYLMRNGWTVEPNARCFIQANHSEVVDEVVGLAMTAAAPARDVLPRGE